MGDNRNMLLAIVLSIAILLGFEQIYAVFYPKAPPPSPPPLGEVKATNQARPDQSGAPAVRPPEGLTGVAPPSAAPSQPTVASPGGITPASGSRAAALDASPRLRIDTPSLRGSIALVGGLLDDLILPGFRTTIDRNSPPVELLNPRAGPNAYYAEIGWDDGGAGIGMPRLDSVWTADSDVLTPERPVNLSWRNDRGLVFTRTIAVDDHFMFTTTQRVENTGDKPITLYPYALVRRYGTPVTGGFFILHEGPIGVFQGSLKEPSYEDIREAPQSTIQADSTGGWLGFTDKYWLTALIPDQQASLKMRFVHYRSNNQDVYQADYLGGPLTLPPGGTISWPGRIFAGAKLVQLLDHYAEAYGIPLFDRAIDFGWFYFLTKPIFYFLIWINEYVGNFGIAILILTVVIKLIFFPLANKSYKAMTQMRKLQPEVMRLRERFAEDKMRLNQEMMALYKREKVNPASGCLPIIIQIPVFFALYKVLFVTIEMRHAPFFGWIQDLSAPDPTSVFNLFGIIPWQPPEFLMIGIWPLIMGVTMYLQQKLNPQPPDPIQAKVFMLLPFVFTFMLAHFPAGLVIYWTWNNILSIAQQWVIMRRAGVKI